MSVCHICSGNLEKVSQKFSLLNQVTSDCRPFSKKNGELAICTNCGVVQKRITQDWLKQISSIYSNYEVYNQGCGLEQPSFNDGVGVARSKKILTWLNQIKILPDQGNILDFGCGNGPFLREFSAYRPRWKLTGFELDNRNKNAIESIPKGKFYSGSLDDIDEYYDFIVTIHTIEHLQDPVTYLNSLSSKLKPEGLILIEVPDLEKSPFDILITDHCSHFVCKSLIYVCKLAGLEVVKVTSDFISNEISLLLKLPSIEGDNIINKKFISIDKEVLKQEKEIVNSHIDWLIDLRDHALNIPNFVGIFGTSIGGTWMASELEGKVTLFVDEDPDRIGNIHMGIPIKSVKDILSSDCIVVPLRKDIADSIIGRLAKKNINFFPLPPIKKLL